MSMSVSVPVSFLFSVQGVELHTCVPAKYPKQYLEAMKEDPESAKYLLTPALYIQIPGYATLREFELVNNGLEIQFTYLSGSPFREFLKTLCYQHDVPFNEHE